jgi:hypothetical protein
MKGRVEDQAAILRHEFNFGETSVILSSGCICHVDGGIDHRQGQRFSPTRNEKRAFFSPE